MTKNARIVIDTLLPSGAHPDLPVGAFDAGFDDFYVEFRRDAVFSMKIGFWAALFLAAWIAPLLIGKLPPISLYQRQTREAALAAMGKSNLYVLRQMYLLLKATVCFSYGANSQVRRAIGFPDQTGAIVGEAKEGNV